MKKCLLVSTVSRQFTLFERGNIKILKELGYEIHCAANFSDANESLDELDIIRHHIDIQRSPFNFKNIKAYGQLKDIVNNNRFDIIHCHSPMGSVIARLVAMRTRRKNKTRVIYTAHGFHFYKGAPIINWLIYYPVEKILSNFTDILITINNEDYELAKNKMKAKLIKYVPGIGVGHEKFDFDILEKDKLEFRERLGFVKDDFLIVYVAELSKRKNQLMLFKAIKRLIINNKNVHALLAGIDSLGGKYHKMAKQMGIENNLHFLGFRKDIPLLLKISDLSVSCSKQEGLPVNIIESMMAGIPVLATDCRGNRDLIQDGVNGYLVKQNDVTGFVEKVDRIINSINVEGKIARPNYCEVQKYSINNVSKMMHDVYKDL